MGSRRIRLLAATGPVAAALIGGLSTDPGSAWFRRLDKPSWYPPPQTFGIVWTGLYAGMAWAAGEVLVRSASEGRRTFAVAYGANLVLNTAWSPLFFRAQRPVPATVEAALLTASAADLARRASRVHRVAGAVLVPYAVWSAFATALSGAIARRNRRP